MARKRVWHVAEHSDAKSKRLTEGELRHKLRENDLSGMELVRRDKETEWVPLHELPVFLEEVPRASDGDPRQVALRREVRSFGGHLLLWLGVCSVFGGFTSGWAWIWGAFLAWHGFRAAPHLLDFWRSRRAVRPAEAAALPEGDVPPELEAFTREATRVRDLLRVRQGDDTEELLECVDSIERWVSELLTRERDLEELTRDETARSLEREVAELDERRKQLGAADGDQRDLLEERYRMLASRRDALERVARAVETLRGRRRIAEDQIRLLRLELAGLDAARLEAPDHRARLEEMRHQLGAMQELETSLGEASEFRSDLET